MGLISKEQIVGTQTITSTPTILTVAAPDGTKWDGGSGAAYKGSGTFKTLQAVYDSIPTGGGWAQIPNTTLSSAFPTASQIDAISPPSVLRQNHWPDQWMVWASAAFNGYGWFAVSPGGHYAGYMNDTYILRVADPVGPVRMHMPAPIRAAWSRTTGLLLDPATWAGQAVESLSAAPEWGPTGCHQYSGMYWCAASEKMVFGGDAQVYVTNPDAIGSAVNYTQALYVFDPYAATPKSAWHRLTVPAQGAVYKEGFGMMDNGDGSVSFRNLGPERWTVNMTTLAVTAGVPGISPAADYYLAWRHVARDAKTGKTYELHKPNLNGVDVDAASLYETTSGAYVKVANLPASWVTGALYQDQQSKIELVNGKAYVIAQTAPGSAGTITLGVHQIDLTTGAVQSFTASPTMTIPEGMNQGTDIAGIHGRFGYVPQVGCFVTFPSARSNVWVFRPPSNWAV